MVHGLLGEGVPQQELLVERARAVGEGFYRGLTPVSGASVIVRGAEGSFAFVEQAPGIYRASLTPRGGQVYSLEVHGPAGQVVTGETRVPEAVRVTVPARDTSVTHRNSVYIPFHWTRAPSAFGYLLLSRNPERPTGIDDLPLGGALRDTTAVTDPVLAGLLAGSARRLQYVVVAVDVNYHRYRAWNREDGVRSSFNSTVQGGYGLFGSYSVSAPRILTLP